ncbi:UNVERIFIED_CONTAM: hypothetical protein FKN15_020823 [Acipenser sinensis]
MLSLISKEANLPKIYTNHCLRSTSVQMLLETCLETKEIMAMTGHKLESSIKSYWHPTLKQRKVWSSLLTAKEDKENSLQPPPVKRSTTNENVKTAAAAAAPSTGQNPYIHVETKPKQETIIEAPKKKILYTTV